MNKVVVASDKSINKKIEKELLQQNKLSREQNAIYADITNLEKTIGLKEDQKADMVGEVHGLEDQLAVTSKLSSMG